MFERFGLQFCTLSHEVIVRNGQFRPFVKDATGLRARPALQLGFDLPGQIWKAVFMKDGIGDSRVGVFRIDEKPVDVEDARTYGWKAGMRLSPER
jgi:hypothetical protein